MLEYLEWLDSRVFHVMYGWGLELEMLGSLSLWISRASAPLFALLYAFVVLYSWRRRKHLLAVVIVAPLAVLAVVYGVRVLCFRPRPFLAEHIEPLLSHGGDSSFPSKHAAAAMVIASVTTVLDGRWGLWAMAAAVLTGLSRVMVGVHYPLDVLAGFLVGPAAVYLLRRVLVGKDGEIS